MKKLINYVPIQILALCLSNVVFADTLHTVTPVSIGVYTTAAADVTWHSKLYVRLAAPVSSTCTHDAVWFARTDNVMLSVTLAAIATNKQAVILVREDTKVGGTVCELVHLESKP